MKTKSDHESNVGIFFGFFFARAKARFQAHFFHSLLNFHYALFSDIFHGCAIFRFRNCNLIFISFPGAFFFLNSHLLINLMSRFCFSLFFYWALSSNFHDSIKIIMGKKENTGCNAKMHHDGAIMMRRYI